MQGICIRMQALSGLGRCEEFALQVSRQRRVALHQMHSFDGDWVPNWNLTSEIERSGFRVSGEPETPRQQPIPFSLRPRLKIACALIYGSAANAIAGSKRNLKFQIRLSSPARPKAEGRGPRCQIYARCRYLGSLPLAMVNHRSAGNDSRGVMRHRPPLT